ncbi:molecular chaperone DnaJ [Candidatus Gastranaerophilus sp. (ex Termes propinquus)]|nr:molecular chaperone DnaJ [Candidatus Gastranaerophilus sp. (ex Termes propinquus)]
MDYYEILDVPKSASKEDIKKAFRAKARQLHPDVNKAPDAEERFKELGRAYETLMDEGKRALYDQYGEDGLKNAGFSNGPFDFGFGDISDIFASFFGGMGGFSSGYAQDVNVPVRGSDLRLDIELEFEQAVFGVEKEIKIDHLEPCEECDATGTDKSATETVCKTCRGQGRVQQSTQTILGNFTSVTTCPTCKGTGKDPGSQCRKCKGLGAVSCEKTIKIKIPQGVDSGSKIRIANEGDCGRNGGRPGDLYVVLFVKSSDTFEREGYDLYSEAEISMPQAVLGDTIIVKTIDGEQELHIPRSTQNLDRLTLKGLGVPHLGGQGQRGNQYVTIKILTPKKLSQEEESLWDSLLELEGKGDNKQKDNLAYLKGIKRAFKR